MVPVFYGNHPDVAYGIHHRACMRDTDTVNLHVHRATSHGRPTPACTSSHGALRRATHVPTGRSLSLTTPALCQRHVEEHQQLTSTQNQQSALSIALALMHCVILVNSLCTGHVHESEQGSSLGWPFSCLCSDNSCLCCMHCHPQGPPPGPYGAPPPYYMPPPGRVTNIDHR
jgi:hypothetical protein